MRYVKISITGYRVSSHHGIQNEQRPNDGSDNVEPLQILPGGTVTILNVVLGRDNNAKNQPRDMPQRSQRPRLS